MSKYRLRAATMLLLPLAVLPVACGDGGNERAALEQDELERELDLALKPDTTPASLEDTAEKPAAEPASAPRRERRPSPRPSPERRNPRPEPPREAPRARPRPVTLTVPTGTQVAVRLEEELSTETNQPGDPFTAVIDDPIVSADGEVLIPSGATVRGRVTAADKSDRVGETAIIKVAFESVSFGGRSYPLQASVVEAHPERRTRTSTKTQAAKIAAGAAAGAILGQVLGKDSESTLKGAAVGAAAGTAIAMGTSDVDAVLPAGSRMVIRLDAPVEVPRDNR
ncbi:MAG TPA: glycine zipper 2TM domain-containing protein [Longimicrobiales bacterium]